MKVGLLCAIAGLHVFSCEHVGIFPDHPPPAQIFKNKNWLLMTSSLLTLHVLEDRRCGGGRERDAKVGIAQAVVGAALAFRPLTVADTLVDEIIVWRSEPQAVQYRGVIGAVEHAVHSSLTRLGRAVTFQRLVSAGRIAVALARQRGSCGGSRCRKFDVSGD